MRMKAQGVLSNNLFNIHGFHTFLYKAIYVPRILNISLPKILSWENCLIDKPLGHAKDLPGLNGAIGCATGFDNGI
jgi:hypothetical protein